MANKRHKPEEIVTKLRQAMSSTWLNTTAKVPPLLQLGDIDPNAPALRRLIEINKTVRVL